MNKNYVFTKEMREISGFGGKYEQACRDMIIAGVQWLEENQDKNLSAKENPHIYGILFEESDDLKALQDHIVNAIGGDATGAMVHACSNHLMFINKNGWEKYVEKMSEKSDE